MDDVTEKNILKFKSLATFYKNAHNYVQTSINYFHKTSAGAGLFTGLPPFNMKSVSQYSTPSGR